MPDSTGALEQIMAALAEYRQRYEDNLERMPQDPTRAYPTGVRDGLKLAMQIVQQHL